MTATEAGRKPNTQVIRAAATRIQLGNRKVAKAQAGKREEWQIEAYGYYDDTGILKSVILFRGNQMAKVRLFPAVRPLDDPEGAPMHVSDPQSGISTELARRAQVEIERIVGESGGTPEILRLLDMNKELAGECYIVGQGARITTEPDPMNPDVTVEVLHPETWDVRSILEVEITQDGKYKVADPLTGEKKELDPKIDICVRVWQRHPAFAKRADCHLRAVLTDLEALLLLTNEVKAESKSRQSNGLLFIPNTMSVSVPTRTTPASDDADPDAIDDPDDEQEPAAMSIGEAIEEAMLDPIEDPGSPYSVLRTIIIGPPEDGDKIKPIDLGRPASENLEARIEARKEAIAQGLNMPVEVVKGHMNTTYANAAQINADIFEKHLEPDCVTICDMWTIGLLQPALLAGTSDPDAERIIVWYDPKQLLDNVDPAANVSDARKFGAIGNEAYRRYTGFSEDDAPEPIELLIDAILNQRRWDPGLVDAVVKQIAPDLKVPPPATSGGGSAQASVEDSLVEALVRLRDEGPTDSARSCVLVAMSQYGKAIRASARPKPKALSVSEKLAAADVHLFGRTHATLNAAMTRTLQKAGNRLKAKAGPTREQLRLVAPEYAAQTMGRKQLELAGYSDEDLIDDDAFEPAVAQFHRDARHAQEGALAIAAGLAGISPTRRRQLAAQQAANLNDATAWMRGELHGLASDRLFAPDEREPDRGEFDPEARVPAGLVRYAMAIAGGATALELIQGTDRYVATSNQAPPGGIGTGELIRDAITESGDITIEAWMWDYGSAFRQREFEPHAALDGTTAETSVDFVTDSEDGWLGDFYFPGDHDGCACPPLVPVYAQASQGAGPAPIAADLLGEGD